MGMAITVREFLADAGIPFDVVHHSHTGSSRDAAAAAQVSPTQVAKCVLLEDDEGYLMAVIPATHRVEMEKLRRVLGRELVLATEQELANVFGDCAKGAIPPVGQAYGVETIWDESFADCPDVYFEAGNHEDLVHISGRDFRAMMQRATHDRIGRPDL
jgi:Ala-tRNA(Pro) deacylase